MGHTGGNQFRIKSEAEKGEKGLMPFLFDIDFKRSISRNEVRILADKAKGAHLDLFVYSDLLL